MLFPIPIFRTSLAKNSVRSLSRVCFHFTFGASFPREANCPPSSSYLLCLHLLHVLSLPCRGYGAMLGFCHPLILHIPLLIIHGKTYRYMAPYSPTYNPSAIIPCRLLLFTFDTCTCRFCFLPILGVFPLQWGYSNPFLIPLWGCSSYTLGFFV